MQTALYLYLTNISSGRIDKYNAQTGAWLGVFANGISDPTRMVIGPYSLLYLLKKQALIAFCAMTSMASLWMCFQTQV